VHCEEIGKDDEKVFFTSEIIHGFLHQNYHSDTAVIAEVQSVCRQAQELRVGSFGVVFFFFVKMLTTFY